MKPIDPVFAANVDYNNDGELANNPYEQGDPKHIEWALQMSRRQREELQSFNREMQNGSH